MLFIIVYTSSSTTSSGAPAGTSLVPLEALRLITAQQSSCSCSTQAARPRCFPTHLPTLRLGALPSNPLVRRRRLYPRDPPHPPSLPKPRSRCMDAPSCLHPTAPSRRRAPLTTCALLADPCSELADPAAALGDDAARLPCCLRFPLAGARLEGAPRGHVLAAATIAAIILASCRLLR